MSSIGSMTSLERKATFQNLYERLFNGQEFGVADELATPDFIDHAAPPNNPHGPDGLRSLVRWIHTAFPDALYTVIDMIEEGDKLLCGPLSVAHTWAILWAYRPQARRSPRTRCTS